MAVPAYWTPSLPSGRAEFKTLVRDMPANSIVVVNGSHSAPETPFNQVWADTFRDLTAAGIVALGYVDTGYYGIDFGRGSDATRADGAGAGQRTAQAWTRQIEKDIDDWYALYGAHGVRGIFLDQTAALCGPGDAYAALYQGVSDYIKRTHPTAYIVMNPGRDIEQCYENMADTFVTFEGPYDQYLHRRPAGWEASAPADKFWHLVYGAPDLASMANAVALSKRRNARYVYVTDGALSTDGRTHPWAGIPREQYWQSELTTVLGRRSAAPSGS
jgi:hypothetical protein